MLIMGKKVDDFEGAVSFRDKELGLYRIVVVVKEIGGSAEVTTEIRTKSPVLAKLFFDVTGRMLLP